MKNKEFLDFILNQQTPPQHLKIMTQKDIVLSFSSKKIVARFLLFQLLGALFSMSICPQFGMGLVNGHGITHAFRLIGDWACAAFCGSLFLSAGLMVAFLGMKGEELWWVWRRFKYSLIILPAVLWSGLMLTNMSLNLSHESSVYHLTWIAAAVLVQMVLMQLRSLTYQKIRA
jgi:hypothetical protein